MKDKQLLEEDNRGRVVGGGREVRASAITITSDRTSSAKPPGNLFPRARGPPLSWPDSSDYLDTCEWASGKLSPTSLCRSFPGGGSRF